MKIIRNKQFVFKSSLNLENLFISKMQAMGIPITYEFLLKVCLMYVKKRKMLN